MTVYIKQNDTSPAITAELRDADGQPVDLSGASVRFHMRKSGQNDVVVDQSASVVDSADALVRYAWADADTATAGVYQAEFEVTYADQSIETFPNAGFILIEITDDIA